MLTPNLGSTLSALMKKARNETKKAKYKEEKSLKYSPHPFLLILIT
jgi:hypothetical protein